MSTKPPFAIRIEDEVLEDLRTGAAAHFAATEEPRLLATDISAFLTQLLDCRTI